MIPRGKKIVLPNDGIVFAGRNDDGSLCLGFQHGVTKDITAFRLSVEAEAALREVLATGPSGDDKFEPTVQRRWIAEWVAVDQDEKP